MGVNVRYLFGSDDYDPVDEIPYGQAEHFEQYLGFPLCNVPAPPGSSATDMADHYITEFWGVFRELGIDAQLYRMRDIYRSGQFNDAIDTILKSADVVRRIYREISGSKRSDRWHPFQVICENCGRLGTTEVTAYDGNYVTYVCRKDLVKWATGCDYHGRVSPFDGNGKLPWKLEWCAKWRTFPVTIEGAGQDHSTKGGSRDVAAACLREIFNQEPPLNCPYEFFLVGGAKMSSSRGVGVTAREMADFLPPDVLRFLMLRTKPAHHVDFDASEIHIVKLFNEFDRYHNRYFNDSNVTSDEKRVYEVSRVRPEPYSWLPDFQLLTALLQMPHIEVARELERRKGSTLTDLELEHLNRRIHAAKYWLENYASEEEKTRLQERLPVRANELAATQVGFLHLLAKHLGRSPWTANDIQVCIFDAARLTPIGQAAAFHALYRVLLDRESGPKAGNLLSFLDRDFVLRRCLEMPLPLMRFWEETGMTDEQFEEWVARAPHEIVAISARFSFGFNDRVATLDSSEHVSEGLGIVEFEMTLADNKRHLKRVLFERMEAIRPMPLAREVDIFLHYAREWVNTLANRYHLEIQVTEGAYDQQPISLP